MARTTLMISALLFLLLPAAPPAAGDSKDTGGTIYPGAGITQARIGQRPPAGKSCNRPAADWEVTCDRNGLIASIVVKRRTHAVERNRLRVGSSLSEVFRYYGYGEKKSVRGGILVMYPEQGIDFRVASGTERVDRITVYNPVPKFPKGQYERYKDQLKQKF